MNQLNIYKESGVYSISEAGEYFSCENNKNSER